MVSELARLRRRGFWLEYATMGWMVVEAGVAIAAGIVASSIALVAFGLDSVIELFSAASSSGSYVAKGKNARLAQCA